MSDRPTFIDLFSGCGGFTLGLLRAGFNCVAAIDSNKQAIAALRSNLQAKSPTGLPPVGFALEADLTSFSPERLSSIIGSDELDVIVGGPPCQGFSTARQRDGSNHGEKRLKEDDRRHLFRNFLNFVEYFQPKVFVIENVLGLRSAAGGRYFTAVQHESRTLGHSKGLPGYRVHSQIEYGVKLGSPQKRRRQLIVGVRNDLVGYFSSELRLPDRAVAGAMLGDAIMDLPRLSAGGGKNTTPYDLNRREKMFFNGARNHLRRHYLERVAEVSQVKQLHNHVARPHSLRDLGDFAKIPEGQSSAELMRAGVEFDFPYDKTTFKDRYTRQHRNRACSTIVAHLSKDGLMFIHPTQNRSLTPREAARVQTFPDWFIFPEPRTHSFRLIGNAVPPLIGESVGDTVRKFLQSSHFDKNNNQSSADRLEMKQKKPVPMLPSSHSEAAQWLAPFTKADRKTMRVMPPQEFLLCWHALLWLFPDLHPENARGHGNEAHDEPAETSERIDPFGRRYSRSGWPVMLEAFGEEAWRRFEAKQFNDGAFYCVEAQRSGLEARERLSTPRPSTPLVPSTL